jgi:hypothetical protein
VSDALVGWPNKRFIPMNTAAAVALLVMISEPIQAGAAPIELTQVTQTDSAHTLFTPDAPDPGRVGQVYQLPQGGFGVSTGGTAQYQTLGTPGGSAISVPGENGRSNVFVTGGRVGTATPR